MRAYVWAHDAFADVPYPPPHHSRGSGEGGGGLTLDSASQHGASQHSKSYRFTGLIPGG